MTLQEKISSYRPSDEAIRVLADLPVVLLAGVVGGGKNTVTEELLKTGDFTRVVTHTTRPPRHNHGALEQDGVDYHFITPEIAETLIDQHKYVEVKYIHGNIYGSTLSEYKKIADQQLSAVADIDIQGVEEYVRIKPNAHTIFLLPPSVDSWMRRLENRYGGDLSKHTDEIQTRFKTAYDEIKSVQHDRRYVLVINDDLDTTVTRVHEIVKGETNQTSEYAEEVTEHLLNFLSSRI